jgi:hypothetical protein
MLKRTSPKGHYVRKRSAKRTIMIEQNPYVQKLLLLRLKKTDPKGLYDQKGPARRAITFNRSRSKGHYVKILCWYLFRPNGFQPNRR